MSTILAMPPQRFIDVGGIRTCYYEAGAGEPIVFIYGSNFGAAEAGASAPGWNLNFVPLSRTHRVIAFDKLGQGYTDIPARDEDYSMAAVIRHAARFIAAMQLPPVHLVGHSRGGFAATRLALDHQHLIRSLTIINSGTLSPCTGTNEVVLAKGPYPPFSRESTRWGYERHHFDPGKVTDDLIDSVVETLVQPRYREGVRKFAEEQLGARIFAPALARQKRETLTWLAEGRLQRPTQIVWGFDDRTAAVEGGFRLFEMIAAHQRLTQLHVINQARHFPFREHPERFNALLAGFVALASQ